MGSVPESVFKSHAAKRFLGDLGDERQLQISRWSKDHDDAHTMEEWSELIWDYDLELDFIISGIHREEATPEEYRHGLVVIAALCMAAYESSCRKEESEREIEALELEAQG